MSARALRRAFLAVEPPPAVLDAIFGCVAHRREEGSATHPGLRWTTRVQWHLTVQFLGRVGDVDAVVDAVAEALRPLVSNDMQLGGAGAFPRPARASVLWLGLVRGREEFTALAAAAACATTRLGYDADERLDPHLTLARAKQRCDLQHLIDEIGPAPVGPAWAASEVVLFESETRPDGARYTAVSQMPVGR